MGNNAQMRFPTIEECREVLGKVCERTPDFNKVMAEHPVESMQALTSVWMAWTAKPKEQDDG